jgi:pyrroloquinoline quinone (PQQ) biosynthesis protein C
MLCPQPRGVLTTMVRGSLLRHVALDPDAFTRHADAVPRADLLRDGDVQLALWMLYELHFRGFDDVSPDLEWDPDLLRARAVLERLLERDLRRRTVDTVQEALDADGPLAERIFAMVAADDGPRLAAYLHREATAAQISDFLRERTVFHLKESDPQSLVLARLEGRAKTALAELLYDEFGGGRPERLHASMFADSLAAAGLESTYGAYIDEVSGTTLAVNNAMSLFTLHRRLRGAAMGHLAAFEATSSVPSRKIAAGIRRVGLPDVVAAYFDEHVEADAVHEQLAVRAICGTMVEQSPGLEADVLLGVATCLLLDGLAGWELLDRWQASGRAAGPVEGVAS